MSKYILLLLTIYLPLTALADDCPQGYYPVRSHPRNAYVKLDGTIVSGAQIKESCHPFRKPKSPVPIFTTRTPKNWPTSNDKFRKWTAAEEASIRAILQQLPKSLTHVGQIKFLRSINASDSPGYSNSFNQVIIITNEIKTHDLKRVVAHELAHFYWDSLQNKEREEFLLAAEWRKSIDGYTASLLRKKVQIPDSYIGPHEDFTNSVELFIHDKAQLKDSPALLKCLENFIK